MEGWWLLQPLTAAVAYSPPRNMKQKWEPHLWAGTMVETLCGKNKQTKWQVPLEALGSAFVLLQERHSWLRARIVVRPIDPSKASAEASNMTKYLVVDEPCNACPVDISTVQYANSAEAIESEVGAPYNEATGPLWRVKIVTFAPDNAENGTSSSDSKYPFQLNLLWLFHHGITDGRSQMQLIKELATVLRQGPDHNSWNPDVLGAPLPIPPCLDNIIGSATTKVREEYSPTWLEPDSSRDGLVKKERENVGVDQRRTRIYPFELDTETLSALLSRCKREGTTVHGALNAAALLAIRQHILQALGEDGELEEKRVMKIDWTGPACIRKYTEPLLPPNSGGCFVVPYMGLATVSGPENFWALAKTIREELVSQLEKGTWRVDFNTAKEAGCVTLAFTEAVFGRPALEATVTSPTFDCGLCISNLGVFDFNQNGAGDSSLRIANIIFTSNTAPSERAFTLTCVTHDGRMDAALLYPQPLLSEASAIAYVDSLVTHLKSAITAP